MALYEYQCAKCGRKTEVIQRFSDPAPTECPHCGGTLAKLLSSPAVQFRGSGFHATDYGRSGGKPEDSSKGKEAEAGASSDAGAGTKGDSAGDGAKESGKEPSKEPTKDGGPSAARDGAAAKGSNAPSKKKKSAKD